MIAIEIGECQCKPEAVLDTCYVEPREWSFGGLELFRGKIEQ